MKKFNRVVFSSTKPDWRTPEYLYKMLDDEFHFNLDVCSDGYNSKCSKCFTIEDDGLTKIWEGNVFCNPPYNDCGSWVKKAFFSNCLSVLLLPARTDSKWFHKYCLDYAEIRFIKGRLRFQGAKYNAPFPSMIVIFRNND